MDHEKLYLHAQRNLEADILNDQIEQIGHDQHLSIGNDRFVGLKKDHHLTIEGESRTQILKDQSLTIEGALQQKIGTVAVLDAGEEIHVNSKGKAVIEAGSELTIKAAGSFIKIDASGVHMVGSAINLNSGGSPGTGSGFKGLLPELPLAVLSPDYDAELEASAGNQAPEVVPIVAAQQKQAIVAAAEQGAPICQVCEEAAEADKA